MVVEVSKWIRKGSGRIEGGGGRGGRQWLWLCWSSYFPSTHTFKVQ